MASPPFLLFLPTYEIVTPVAKCSLQIRFLTRKHADKKRFSGNGIYVNSVVVIDDLLLPQP